MKPTWWGKWAVALAMLALLAGGCGSNGGDPELAIYVSAPAGPDGRSVVAAAEMALESAGEQAGGVEVRLEVLRAEEDAAWAAAEAAAAARAAARDSTAIGYVGELDPQATRTSAPILNEAGILQVQPGPRAATLTRQAPGSSRIPQEVQPSGERTLIQLGPRGPLPTNAPQGAAAIAHGFEERSGTSLTAAGAYSYEAVMLILDAIDRAEDPLDRSSVRSAAFATEDRESVIGSYSVDEVGDAVVGTAGSEG